METESFSKELLVWLILFLPVGAFAINTLIIRPFIGSTSRLALFVVVGALVAAFVLSLYQFIQVRDAAEHQIHFASREWLTIGNFHLEIGLKLDSLTSIMLLVVTSVSTLVQIYSHGYMKEDGGYVRYFSYMALFTASMIGIVLANNLVMLYAFWELVGLCSYLLIGFWFTRPAAAAAAKKAFIVTRVGDVGFLLAILWAFHKTGTFDIGELTEMAHAGAIATSAVTLLAIGAFAGAVGKSAQFPLNTWLPDAMEGPTPVSSLIHAATMVAAGVFLVARLFPIYEASDDAMNTVAVIGAITAIMAATMGLVATDIKRVLAFSTVSQLGFMMLTLGLGAAGAAIFHLFTHAFFKCLLFLGAGSVNHSTGTFDMRKMGGLSKKMPVTYILFLIGSLSLAGIFPFAGFWSKDEMLGAMWESNRGLFFVALTAAWCTAFYIFRAVFLTFHGTYKGGDPSGLHAAHAAPAGGHDAHGHAPAAEHAHAASADHGHAAAGHTPEPHESPSVMLLPMGILAVMAIVAGFANPPGFDFLSVPSHWMGHFLFPEETIHPFNMTLAIVASGVSISGIVVAWAIYAARVVSAEKLGQLFKPFYVLFSRKYFQDEIYEGLIVKTVMYNIGSGVVMFVDTYIVDGIANLTGSVGRNIGKVWARRVQVGQVQVYGTVVGLGLLIAILAFTIRNATF